MKREVFGSLYHLGSRAVGSEGRRIYLYICIMESMKDKYI
jgi:hypothetical protein